MPLSISAARVKSAPTPWLTTLSWTTRTGSSIRESVAGLEAIHRYVVDLGAIWSRQAVEPDEFIPVGADRVVVAQRIISTGRDGIEVAARTAAVFTLEGGKITH
jgi:hypothetical protein